MPATTALAAQPSPGPTVTLMADGIVDNWPAALVLADEEHVLFLGDGVRLSPRAIAGGLDVLLHRLEPTAEQRARVGRGVESVDPERLARAARLLAALEAAGQALGVDPEDWRAVTSLPAACWDVTR